MICILKNKGIQIDGPVIRYYVEQLQREANKRRLQDEQIELNVSKGRIEKFKYSHSLRFQRMHGEAFSANQDCIHEQIAGLKRFIMNFAQKDVWNADKFSLLYRQPIRWTLFHKPEEGSIKEKSWLSLFSCCNRDGLEILHLMVIESAKKPRRFKGKAGIELGFDYYNLKNVWMTQIRFCD